MMGGQKIGGVFGLKLYVDLLSIALLSSVGVSKLLKWVGGPWFTS